MVDNSNLDLLFHALSDSTRRAMLSQLAKSDSSVTELAKPHDLTLAGISKHLKVLEKARFVEKTKDGRTFRCRANLKPLDQIYSVLEDLGMFWKKQLDSLEQFLSEDLNKGEDKWKQKKKRSHHRKS